MNKHWITALLLACLSSLAIAAGGGGGGGGGGGEMEKQQASDPDYVAGEQAAKQENWPQTVAKMQAVLARDPKNADAWNYLGYAQRHLGDMDASFKSYGMALQINPKHRGAHEYVGEAYLKVGRLDKAEEHLKALDKLCFFPCEEYSELKEKIADYRHEHGEAAK